MGGAEDGGTIRPSERWTMPFLAALPIGLLLAALVRWRWPAQRAGLAAYVLSLLLAASAFGAPAALLAQATAKGLALALYVVTIIWASGLLYSLLEACGAAAAISGAITSRVSDPALQALLLAGCAAAFLQGIAGFGVPVAIVAPLLVAAGLTPARAAAAVLVGHSWAVSFGSMAASYYTIGLVTGLPAGRLAVHLALTLSAPILVCCVGVICLAGGFAALRRTLARAVAVSLVMACVQAATAVYIAPQVASLLAGLSGCLVLLLGVGERGGPAPAREGPSFHIAFAPYYFLTVLSLLAQLPEVHGAFAHLRLGWGFPGGSTAWGHVVAPVRDYAAIRLVGHPAPLIVAATGLAGLALRLTGRWRRGALAVAWRRTVRQSAATTLAIGAMVAMALVMTDSGQTSVLAAAAVSLAGPAFPLIAPLIGAFGCLLTGSNTNSNVLFGAMQTEAALKLGLDPVPIAAAQSAGGSLGSAVAPAKVMMGAAAVDLKDRAGDILRLVLPFCLLALAIVGLTALALA